MGFNRGLSGFSLLMSITGYGVAMSRFLAWNSLFSSRASGSILSTGGSMKWVLHSSRKDLSILTGSVRILPWGVPVSVILMLFAGVLNIAGLTRFQKLRGSSFLSLFSCLRKSFQFLALILLASVLMRSMVSALLRLRLRMMAGLCVFISIKLWISRSTLSKRLNLFVT